MITHLGWSECLNVCLITFTLNNWEEIVLLGNIFKGTCILKHKIFVRFQSIHSMSEIIIR